MSQTFARSADRATWIRNHATTERHRFECYGNSCNYYLLEDADPDMLIWFGYCTDEEAFYISHIGSKKHREQILRMECIRLFHSEDKSHLHAVQRVLRDINVKGQFRKTLIALMLQFYQEYADKFAGLHDLSIEQEDIVNSAEFLKNLKG